MGVLILGALLLGVYMYVAFEAIGGHSGGGFEDKKTAETERERERARERYIYIYMYMSNAYDTCTHACYTACVHSSIFLNECKYVNIYTYTCIHTYLHTYVYVYAFI